MRIDGPEIERNRAVVFCSAVPGRNVIFPEVHKESAKSSDLRFELQLKANVPTVSDAVNTLHGIKFSEPTATWLKSTPEYFRKLAGQPE